MEMTKYIIKGILSNKLPIAISLLGISFPYIVYKYTDNKTKKLNDGILSDINRVSSKGKRFIDIESN